MGSIRNLSDRFKTLDFNAIKEQSLIKTAPGIIPEMNEQQLSIGQLADGEEFPEKNWLQSKEYAQQKLEAGGMAPFRIPDLKLTGSFYDGVRTVVTPQLSLKTYSIDTKAPKLETKYGSLIFGASPINLAKYATENLQPVLIKKLKEQTVGA